MKNNLNKFLILVACLLVGACLHTANAAKDNGYRPKLGGRWLIQVEELGQAYYVNPTDQLAYPLGKLSQTPCLIKTLALGINETDYYKFTQTRAPSRLSGRLLLRAHAQGQAYYVDPISRRLYPINSVNDVSQLLKTAGLGINNNNLNKILAKNNKSLQIKTCQQYHQSQQSNHNSANDNQQIPTNNQPLCFGARVYIHPLTQEICSQLTCNAITRSTLKSQCLKGVCGAECSDNETRACTINGKIGKQGCNPSYCQFFTSCGLPVLSNGQTSNPTCSGGRLEPNITISDDRSNGLAPNFCSNQTITFSTAITNCQQPSYQWLINDVVQDGHTDSQYSTTVNENDIVKVVLNCADDCLTTATASAELLFNTAITSLTTANLQLTETDDDAVHLSWDNTPCAEIYEVWRGYENNTSTMSLIATTSETSFDDQDLYLANDYYYAIKPLNNQLLLASNWSDIVAYHRCQESGQLCLIQKYKQNFDDMGTGLTLPDQWTIATSNLVRTINNFINSSANISYLGGNHYDGFESASNGTYNFGAGDKDSASDRSVGGLSSNTGSRSVNIYYALTNTTGNRINRINVTYAAEKYRNGSNPAAFALKFYYSFNGVYWWPVPDLTAQFDGPDDDNYGFTQAPGERQELSSNIDLIQELNNNETLYLAWNYSVASNTAAGNARALAIDDITVKSYMEVGQEIGYQQNFDAIGTSSTAVLPSNWQTARDSTSPRVINTNGTPENKTGQVGGNNLSSGAASGVYNFGAGTSTTAVDRSIGGLSSSSNNKSINFYYTFTNNSTNPITGFDVSYDVEKYRNGSNPAGFSIKLFYSYDFTNWNNAGLGTSLLADSDNIGFTQAPSTTTNIAGRISLPTALSPGDPLYFAWNYSVTTGTSTSNAQALGIDNVRLKWFNQ